MLTMFPEYRENYFETTSSQKNSTAAGSSHSAIKYEE